MGQVYFISQFFNEINREKIRFYQGLQASVLQVGEDDEFRVSSILIIFVGGVQLDP